MTTLGVARSGRYTHRIFDYAPECPKCGNVTARADLFTRVCKCGWSGSGRVTLAAKELGLVRWNANERTV